MSEQGWQDFLVARGVDDWVVLHGGATAVFRVRSLGEAARLAEAVVKAPGLEGSGVLLTVADASLTVRLSRDLWQLEPRHVELARAVSAVARTHGAAADRAAVQEVQLAIAAKRDAIDLGFWRAVLGYVPMADDNAVDPLGHGFDGLDAGARRGQAVAARDASRCLGRARARHGAPRGGTRCGRPHRGPVPCTIVLDARRPRGQPRLYLRVARRVHPETSGGPA